MPRILYTVDNLIDEVRSILDEENNDSVDTDRDILPALNRAQDFAMDVLARRYPEPITAYTTLELVGNQSEYDIPENVFEDRVLRIEIAVPSGNGRSTYREVKAISWSDLTLYESSSLTNVPLYYAVYGRKIRFVSAPTGTYNARMWYLRSPEKLVRPQGRITILNSVSNYCIVDTAGSSLTTESDQLGSYVNVIDGQTGEIKQSLQIQILSGNKLTFRSSPTRSVVLNRTISGSIDSTVNQDDYIAPVDGTCVPYYGRPTSNFLVQYTVEELTRKLGGDSSTEFQALDKFEKQLEKTYTRRPRTLRIKKRNKAWGPPVRRLFWE